MSPGGTARRDDGRLWAFALLLSLLANVVLFGLVGVHSLISRVILKSRPPTPAAAAETTVTIFPEMFLAETAPVNAPELKAATGKPRVVRTSENQRAPRPDNPTFQGERDTRATSNRVPDASAPPLPSQAGVAPRDDGDFETTESNYKDGNLDGGGRQVPETLPDPAPVIPPVPPNEIAAKELLEETPAIETPPPPPPAPPPARLMEGPYPVEVPVPEEPSKTLVTPSSPQMAKAETPRETRPVAERQDPQPAALPKQTAPEFKGFQKKTAIQGSISRTGQSALDVADTPLGRYQASISRAVEQEWQRNCVRHRDFITPGFLTVRFFVETSGKVRSVQFVGDMETGEVQKGFTLNSIRDAKIPAMPAPMRKEYNAEPLEIIFNFYF